MDKLIITIPDWVVCVIGLWFILQAIENGVNIYLFYLKRKLERMENTTSSTICLECDFYRKQFFSYCADCGASLK